MLKRLLHLGITDSLTHAEIREVKALNLSLLIGLLLGIPGVLLFLPSYFDSLAMLVPTAYMVIIVLAMYLSFQQYHIFARRVFWIATILCLFSIVALSAVESYVNMYSLIVMTASFLIFPPEDRLFSIICGLLSAAGFLFFQLSGIGGLGLRYQPSEGAIMLAKMFNLLCSVSALAFFSFSLARGYSTATTNIQGEKNRSEALLRSILPLPIIEKLNTDQHYIAENYTNVAVFFADIAEFTKFCKPLKATEVVQHLNSVFIIFDRIAAKYGIEKIKTIGDSYMAVCGAPLVVEDPEIQLSKFALEVRDTFQAKFQGSLNIRIGIHSGPAVAGIIGEQKFSYDLWGDTVNIASRLETHGEVGKIHVSESFKEKCKNKMQFTERGYIELKGLGVHKTSFLNNISIERDEQALMETSLINSRCNSPNNP